MTRAGQNSIYKMITDKIIDGLKKGVVPWSNPMLFQGDRNYRGTRYNGINVLLLTIAKQLVPEMTSNIWLTKNQINKLGGRIAKGAKGQTVVYWNFKKVNLLDGGSIVRDEDGNPVTRSIAYLKYYMVFNFAQTEGIEEPKWSRDLKRDNSTLEDAQAIIDGWEDKPEISVNGYSKAFYSPKEDKISIPEIDTFTSSEAYYSVLYHEAVHSTGHPQRLNRFNVNEFVGREEYSKEELVAEIGASFLCGIAGIRDNDEAMNSQAYINGWVSRLEDDVKMIVQAAGKAQKAVNAITGNLYEETE